jgi:hypothetical protein
MPKEEPPTLELSELIQRSKKLKEAAYRLMAQVR